MNPEIEQAFRDWLGDRACLDRAGRNYRLKVKDDRGFTIRRVPAPWNKAVKRAFPDGLCFHCAAVRWQEQTP
jgi:hypothetical protein